MTPADPITLAECDILNSELRKPLADLLAKSGPELIAALVLALRPAMGPPLTPERQAYLKGVVADLLAG